jgi:hypothetical protein
LYASLKIINNNSAGRLLDVLLRLFADNAVENVENVLANAHAAQSGGVLMETESMPVSWFIATFSFDHSSTLSAQIRRLTILNGLRVSDLQARNPPRGCHSSLNCRLAAACRCVLSFK